jgi:hypothetical protein
VTDDELGAIGGTGDERLARLAVYRPFADGGAGLTTAIQRLIFGAAMIDGGQFETLAICRDRLLTLWRLDFEIEEIRTAADALAAQGRCERTRSGFSLTQETLDDLAQRAAEAGEFETTAFEEWAQATRAKTPDLSDDDVQLLRQDLNAWLQQIIRRHGIEAALMLYPEDQRARAVIETIDAEGLRILPERSGRLAEIREDALRVFVRNPTESQRIYLANRLEAAFDLTVLTLDPGAAKLAQKQFNAHRVYLDTNFLYALLGFAPATESLAAHRLVQLTKDLGFELAITPWTVNELRTSLQRSRTALELISLPSRDYADLMVQAASEKGFDRAFWIAYRDKNMSRQDFFDRAAHFTSDLEQLGIHSVDEGCQRVDRRAEEVKTYVTLLDHVGGQQWKETVVLEHDAKHRLLVEQLRGDGHIEFTNARYWFLTQDSRLPVFARLSSSGRTEITGLPFCITSSAWAQVMRAFTPRTDDWDQMVVDLLASPYVGWKRGMSLPAVLEVVARVDQYTDSSVELAWEVLADTAKMAEISQLKKSGAPTDEIAAAIDATFVADAEASKERAAAARELQLEAERTAVSERARADQLRADLDDERRRREALETDLKHAQEATDVEARELADRLSAIEAKHEADLETERSSRRALQKKIDDAATQRSTRRRLALASVLAVLGVAAPTVLLATGTVGGALSDVIAAVGGALLLCGAVAIALPDRWSNRIFTIVGVLLGVAALVVAVAAAPAPHTRSGSSTQGK